MPKITVEPDNIVYLDFDDILCGIDSKLDWRMYARNFHYKEEDGNEFKRKYFNSDLSFKISPGAKAFLKAMENLYPQVQVKFFSTYDEFYTKELLEWEHIDPKKFEIIDELSDYYEKFEEFEEFRSIEKNYNPGLRFIANNYDDKLYRQMVEAAQSRKGNTVIGENASLGRVHWEDHLILIVKKLGHLIPVMSYLNGSSGNRFHLFSANVNSMPSALKDNYHQLQGDELKRSILNQLILMISKIDNPEELQNFKKSYKKSPEYLTLAKGQGLVTRLFSLETDSQRAVETIFNNREHEVLGKRSPTQN